MIIDKVFQLIIPGEEKHRKRWKETKNTQQDVEDRARAIMKSDVEVYFHG